MNLRNRLLTTSLLAGVATVLTALPAAAQTVAPAASAEAEVEEIVVTGSRLRVRDYTTASPVTSVTSEAIEYSGTANLTDFLRSVPALTGSFGTQEGSDVGQGGLAGLNLLDLRNLGSERTLVLVNGRRHVASALSTDEAGVDINTIPVGLIDRIEVLTGGASATYGADAVSGVVNFILKDNFEGVDARAQYGVTQEGGGAEGFASVLVGHNFMENRGNVTFNFEVSKADPIRVSDRDYSRVGNRRIYVANPDDLNDDPNVPDLVILGDVRYPDTSPGGSVLTDTDFDDDTYGFDFQGNGEPWRTGRPTSGFYVIGGSGSLTDEFEDELQAGLERHSFNSTFRFDLNDNHRIFAEAKAVRTETGFVTQPSYDFGYGDLQYTGIYVPLDNPFIPASILADAQRDNLAVSMGLPPGVFVQRDNIDLGYTTYDITRETYRGVLGLSGKLTPDIEYEVSYVYGQTDERNTYRNARINERWFAAIDAVRDPATGQIVCRSDLDPNAANPNIEGRTFGTTFTPGRGSGCVPADIFGPDVSAAARDWINTSTTSDSRITQHVLTGFVRGDSSPLFELPAGPISYVLGGEYRKESYRFRADPLQLLATQQSDDNGGDLLYDLTWSGQGTNVDGEFDVKEAFAEVSIPLLRDLPFVRALTANGQFRYSEYDLSGVTRTWQGGLRWQVNPSITLRGSTARAVRAPNINDLFAPQQQSFALLEDPCDQDNVGAGSSFRMANCTAALAPFGLTPSTFDNTATGSVEGISGGNPDLEPEKADTVTAGIVLQPSFLPGLSLSLDYYEIDLSNAIQLFTAQTIVDKCYDLPTPNDFCGLVSRNDTAGTGRGFIDFYQRVALNVARYETSGYDFTVRYRLDPADFGVEREIGTFDFTLVGNKMEELTFVELEDADPDVDLGDPNKPEWQVALDVTWRKDNWTVNYGYSWYDQTLAWGVDEPNRFVTDPDYVENRYYDERSIHDIQVRYEWDKYAVYAGVNNFTNQEPQAGFVDVPYVTPQGRFFYVGATAKLGL
jgi:outer membrane receptor protein involved in Fe transport